MPFTSQESVITFLTNLRDTEILIPILTRLKILGRLNPFVVTL